MANGMSCVAVDNFVATAGNLLKARTDGMRMHAHVSPVIYKIRDHGPAILDGEFYKDNAAALPGETKVPAIDTAADDAAAAPVVSQLSGGGIYKAMFLSIVLLTIALVSVGFYAWQQKLHVNDLQAELKIYDDLDKDF